MPDLIEYAIADPLQTMASELLTAKASMTLLEGQPLVLRRTRNVRPVDPSDYLIRFSAFLTRGACCRLLSPRLVTDVQEQQAMYKLRGVRRQNIGAIGIAASRRLYAAQQLLLSTVIYQPSQHRL